MLNFAIIGFGGLGKNHFKNAVSIAKADNDIKLVALCDVDNNAFENIPDNQKKDFDLSPYKIYNDAETLFKNEKLDFVITALPTYIHEKIAVMAMKHKIHVFSEKPIAISHKEAQNMIDAAKENNVKLMIGQCLRFHPAYIELKKLIDSKKYGNVVSAEFARLSLTPNWSWKNWMLDESKSGMVYLDLHIHDVDFINYVFGKPLTVTSFTTNSKFDGESVFTVYRYSDNKFVSARADWAFPDNYPFKAEFTVKFEKAALEFRGNQLKLYTGSDTAVVIDVTKNNCYVDEVIEFIDCIRKDRASTINPPESNLISLDIALAEKKSAESGKSIDL